MADAIHKPYKKAATTQEIEDIVDDYQMLDYTVIYDERTWYA